MYHEPPIPSSMDLRDLKNLIRSGEGLTLEFKRAISSPEKIAREIAAFANTHGGHLIIGVDDNHTIVGVESYHEQDFFLEQAARELCHPPLSYRMEIVPFYEKEILIVYIDESLVKPVTVQNGEGRVAYIRIKDQSVRAGEEMTDLMISQSSDTGITFQYGIHEQKLFRYLNEYPNITVQQYSSLADITRTRASKILVNLTRLGVLKLFKKDRRDFFTLSP
ncbi:MAG: ATP-binding protein [Balneolales bacterium]